MPTVLAIALQIGRLSDNRDAIAPDGVEVIERMGARQTGPHLLEQVIARDVPTLVEHEQGEERAGLLAPFALAGGIRVADSHLETTEETHVHFVDVGTVGNLRYRRGTMCGSVAQIPGYRDGLVTTAGRKRLQHMGGSIEDPGIATVDDGSDKPEVTRLPHVPHEHGIGKAGDTAPAHPEHGIATQVPDQMVQVGAVDMGQHVQRNPERPGIPESLGVLREQRGELPRALLSRCPSRFLVPDVILRAIQSERASHLDVRTGIQHAGDEIDRVDWRGFRRELVSLGGDDGVIVELREGDASRDARDVRPLRRLSHDEDMPGDMACLAAISRKPGNPGVHRLQHPAARIDRLGTATEQRGHEMRLACIEKVPSAL